MLASTTAHIFWFGKVFRLDFKLTILYSTIKSFAEEMGAEDLVFYYLSH